MIGIGNTTVAVWWSHQYGCYWLHLADAPSSPSNEYQTLYYCLAMDSWLSLGQFKYQFRLQLGK